MNDYIDKRYLLPENLSGIDEKVKSIYSNEIKDLKKEQDM